MPTNPPQLSSNQFAQLAVPGMLDLAIAASGSLSGRISAAQATPLKAGATVKLDDSVKGGLPQFVAAAVGDVAIGKLKYDPKRATMSAGDSCEVVGLMGQVMFLTAGEEVVPGEQVQDDADGLAVIEADAGQVRGTVIDYAAQGQLTRVILSGLTALAS